MFSVVHARSRVVSQKTPCNKNDRNFSLEQLGCGTVSIKKSFICVPLLSLKISRILLITILHDRVIKVANKYKQVKGGHLGKPQKSSNFLNSRAIKRGPGGGELLIELLKMKKLRPLWHGH